MTAIHAMQPDTGTPTVTAAKPVVTPTGQPEVASIGSGVALVSTAKFGAHLKTPPTYGKVNLESALLASGDGATSLAPSAQVSGPARRIFDANARTQYKIPGAAVELIQNSPQLDSIDGTKNDSIRCGPAAISYAMVFDATSAAATKENAAAVRSLVTDMGAKLSANEDLALQHLSAGSLSPTDMAHLQEALLKVGRLCGPGEGSGGLSIGQMAGLTVGLRERGALTHSQGITLGLSRHHWEVTSNTDALRHATSWPNASGHAVVDNDRHPEQGMIDPETKTPNAEWGGEIYLNGSEVRIATPSQNSKGTVNSDRYYNYTITATPGSRTPLPISLTPDVSRAANISLDSRSRHTHEAVQ